MNAELIERACKNVIASKDVRLSREARIVSGGDNIVPSTKKPWVSVEIECFFKVKSHNNWYNLLATAFVKSKLHKFVRIKDDGSIDPWEHNEDCDLTNYDCVGIEVVVSAPESKIINVLQKVCVVLNALGAKTNDSCGLHIHIDHRMETQRNPLVSFNNLYYLQDIMFRAAKSSRKKCGYCDPIHSNDLFDCMDADRYSSINAGALNCHKTLEVRVFHGTTKFREISHFVKLVLGAIHCKKILNKKISIRELDSIRSIPADTRRFVKSKSKPRSYHRKAA